MPKIIMNLNYDQLVNHLLSSIRPDISPDLRHKLCTHAIGERGEKDELEHGKCCIEVTRIPCQLISF